MQPIWDRWNAKSPQDQAADSVSAMRVALDSEGEFSCARIFMGGKGSVFDVATMDLRSVRLAIRRPA